MSNYDYWNEDYIEHYGIPNQKWGLRRYQYEDGSLTPEGRKRYLKGDGRLTRAGKKELQRRNKILRYARGQQLKNGVSVENFEKKATDLKDVRYKKYEQQYKDIEKQALKSIIIGSIGTQILAYPVALFTGNSFRNYTLATGGDEREAIMAHILAKGAVQAIGAVVGNEVISKKISDIRDAKYQKQADKMVEYFEYQKARKSD